VTVSGSHPAGLVPVHVGQPEPTQDDPAAAVDAANARESGWPPRRQDRVPLVGPGIDWRRHGLEPRWLGMETSDCTAALNPSIFHGHGADELQRFLAGANSRQEPALVIAAIGDAELADLLGIARAGASVHLPGLRCSISGRRLPAGSQPTLAGGLGAADRDLGLRLLGRPAGAPWWTLALHGLAAYPGAGGPPISYEPEGELRAILVDALGEPVVAVWTPPAGDQRWYIIPDAIDWDSVLGWLVHQALPAYAPGALRRARSPQFVDSDLQTPAELAARSALAEMAVRHADERVRREGELEAAQAAAEPVRYGLLYGTGTELVDAVNAVLHQARFATVNLDAELGGTRSADLLVTFQQQRRLVEVKAASGAAAEALVGDLQRHLATWPELRPQQPVGGGVLIVNHQHRLEPSQRAPQVYSRPEFVASLTMPVISTRALFDWWRAGDWAAVRDAILGPA
jgi:hypothetical protein